LSGLVTLIAVLLAASAYGIWHRASRGRVKGVSEIERSPLVAILDGLGEQATLVQFSSAFCSPCRATKALLTDIAAKSGGVKHVEIDAESQLALVCELHIRSTPTTLFLDSAGREVGRAVGAPKREQVLSALAAIQ
jgi:thioredoxin-like negative regulator of GroEL